MASIYDKASLVLIPSGTKTSKVYSQVPTNGDGDFTFSRSTAATRVNASGNIEKETENLFSGSGDLANTSYWPHSNIQSATGGQAGYDGTSNAVKIVESTGTGQHIIQQSVLSPNVVQTISIYAKASGRDFLLINQSGVYKAFYNLSTGSLGSVDSNVIDATMTDVGGGWYRCTYTANITYTGARIGMAQSNGTDSYTGDGTSGILIQDAQLEQGLVARDYIETTTTAIYGGITDNVPRLDYTDSSCPALLLEPQRRNIIPHSEYFDDWSEGGAGGSITMNYGISPEGLQNATRFQAGSFVRYVIYKTISSVSSGKTYNISLYAKSLSGTQKIRIGADNGCVTPQGAETFEVNETWKRIDTNIASTASQWNVFIDNIESGILCTGTALSADLLIYGFQVEDDGAGNGSSYATSYIPTYGSAVTRNQDDCENTNLDLLSQDAATYFLESTPIAIASNNILEVRGNGSTNDRFLMQTNSSGILRILVRNSGSTILDSNISSAVSAGTKIKVALKYTSTNISVFVDGVKKIDSDLSVNFGSPLDWINLEGTATANNDALGQHQFLFFPTALTDQEAIDLTTID